MNTGKYSKETEVTKRGYLYIIHIFKKKTEQAREIHTGKSQQKMTSKAVLENCRGKHITSQAGTAVE